MKRETLRDATLLDVLAAVYACPSASLQLIERFGSWEINGPVLYHALRERVDWLEYVAEILAILPPNHSKRCLGLSGRQPDICRKCNLLDLSNYEPERFIEFVTYGKLRRALNRRLKPMGKVIR